jgi:hypothetical protein
MEKNPQFADDAGEGSPVETAPRPCKCGRGPWRPGQRNCLTCNREANKRYRQSLKKQEQKLKSIEDAGDRAW